MSLNELYISTSPWEIENLEYIAGAIAHKFENKYLNLVSQNLINTSDDWINTISKGIFFLVD